MNDVDKEAFDKYVKENQSSYFGVPIWEIDTDRKIWQAACEYKQKEIDELIQKLSSVWKEAEEFYLDD